MTLLRRWWRRLTARLHSHDDDDCADCIAMVLAGYLMAHDDIKARREAGE